MKKVPHVTLPFWVMKTRSTTLGETAGDLDDGKSICTVS